MEEKNKKNHHHNKGEKAYTLPNSLIQQILTFVVVLIFCCITILTSIWMITLIKKEGLVSIGGIPVITFFAGYSAYVGLLVLRHITAAISYDKHGFTMTKRGDTEEYAWSTIAKTKYYGIFQVLRLSNANGKTIYTTHGVIRENRKFIQVVGDTVGYTSDVF